MIRVIPLALALLAATPAFAADASDWQGALDRAVAAAQAAEPDLAASIADLPAVPTRAGTLHMVDPQSPYGLVLLADRLRGQADPSEIRVALAKAIVGRGHELPEIMAGLVSIEDDPAVLAALLHGLKRVDGELALPLLRQALGHPDAGVRLDAAVVAASQDQGDQLAPELIAALDDGLSEVRGRAARALGRHRVAAATGPLQARLHDPAGDVRLQALRALEQIDPEQARMAVLAAGLAQDPDPRVARAAVGLGRD